MPGLPGGAPPAVGGGRRPGACSGLGLACGPFFRNRAPLLWPVVGVAAGVAAFLVMSAVQPSAAPKAGTAVAVSAPVAPGTMVPASKVAVVKLDFTVDVGVEQADFQVGSSRGAVVLGGRAGAADPLL